MQVLGKLDANYQKLCLFSFDVITGWLCIILVFEKNFQCFLILGDTHLPGKEIAAKENVIEIINSWDDVEGVTKHGLFFLAI